MKKYLSIFLLGSFFLLSNTVYSAKGKSDQAGEQVNSSKISIVSSPELESLVSAWISAYSEEHAGQEFAVSYNADNLPAGSIYFFTKNNALKGIEGLAGKLVVGHEIIVPVMNVKNPMLEKLSSEGMTAGDFSQLLSANAERESSKEEVETVPLRVYVSDYDQLSSKLADFCKINSSSVSAEKVSSAEELLSVVRSDVNAIGFCRLTDVLNSDRKGFADGIAIVPIDKNSNGQIDGFERIYSTPEELTRGAWIGKYPRKLCCDVIAASGTFPLDQNSNDFLEWVIDDGQEPLTYLGFSNLSTREKTAGMLALNPASSSGFDPSAPVGSNVWVIIFAAAALIVIVYFAVRARNRRNSGIQSKDIVLTSALNVDSIKAPAGLFYDKTHTWAFMEQNGLVKVGVDDFLPHVTGKLSQIKMMSPGEKIRKGDKILTIVREGKQLDIYSPITGYIKEQNKTLINDPSLVNADPYSAGWVYQVEPANWLRETKFMFMAGKFKDWLDDEFVRLKDFISASANSNAVVYNHIVLQDGGELTDHVLANLEPEVWDDFQTQFIDASR